MNPAEQEKEVQSSLRSRRWFAWCFRAAVVLVIVWAVAAYVALPLVWRHYENQPAMQEAPKTTVTRDGAPGDPLNVGLVGGETEILQAFDAAGWSPADPITVKSSLRIIGDTLFRRPYECAPVSHLYLWGRSQDLAFEKLAGKSPRRRHHVRFWRSHGLGEEGKPLWVGAATFDRSVGLSHRTGQVTHHIAPDIDAERDTVMGDLQSAGQLVKTYQVTGVGSLLLGKNGGGDWYYTDGELTIGVLSQNNVPQTAAPAVVANPPPVEAKNTFWRWLRGWLARIS